MDSAPWTVTGGREPGRGRWNRESLTGFRAEGVTAGMGWGQEGSTEWGRHTDGSQGRQDDGPRQLLVTSHPRLQVSLGAPQRLPAIGPAPCPGFHPWLKAFGFWSLWPPWSTWTCRSSRASVPSPTRSGKAVLRRGSLCPRPIQNPLLCLATLSLSCGQINGPPKTTGPNLWKLTRDYMAKRGVCRCDKVKDLEMGTWDKPGLSGGALNVITGVLMRGRQRGI